MVLLTATLGVKIFLALVGTWRLAVNVKSLGVLNDGNLDDVPGEPLPPAFAVIRLDLRPD